MRVTKYVECCVVQPIPWEEEAGKASRAFRSWSFQSKINVISMMQLFQFFSAIKYQKVYFVSTKFSDVKSMGKRTLLVFE
jgi:hypothetical protein